MNIDVEPNPGRRLPVYLLLDCSTSMSGAPIQAVQRGVEQFVREVQQDPQAVETAHIGVITFASTAEMVTNGLVSIDEFQPPQLSAKGDTKLGAALRLLQQSLDSHLKIPGKTINEGKGDYKALVFILTDGEPTDEWEGPRNEILNLIKQGIVLHVITVGCGPRIKQENLKAIAIGQTFYMDDSDASFRAFFKWMSMSVQTASEAASQTGGEQSYNLPPPPSHMQFVK